MSSKKILAASMAAALAAGSMAIVASADDPVGSDAAASDDTVVISGLGLGAENVDYAILDINSTATISTSGDEMLEIKSATDQSKNAYSKIKVGLWEALKDFNITEMTDATIKLDLEANASYSVNALIDDGSGKLTETSNFGKFPALKDEDGKDVFVKITHTAEDAAANEKLTAVFVLADGSAPADTASVLDGITLTDIESSAVNVKLTDTERADGLKAWRTAISAAATYNSTTSAAGRATKTVKATSSKKLEGSWRNANSKPDAVADWADGAPVKAGATYGPVEIEAAFDLADGEKLEGSEIKSLKWNLTGKIKVDGNTYNKYVKDKYGVSGSYVWNNGWSDEGTNFQYTESSTTYIGLAVVAQSSVNANAKCGVALPDNLTAEPEVKKTKGNLNISKDGGIDLFYGGAVNPNVLKKLNNGGTVTFELKEEIPAGQYILGNLEFLGGNGNYFVDVAHSYTISGKTITFDFPAGLTEHKGAKDPWGNFIMNWRIRKQDVTGMGGAFEGGTAPTPASWDDSIVSITFKANASAPADNTSSSNNSGASGNTPSDAPATSDGSSTVNPGATDGSNSGANGSGDNKPTGIALAIAPAALACAFVAVAAVKSKKR